ncbi:hypothetical protein L2E82_12580 [Cichorium intybus]|uniref:Uncharacterized protein n=1 Tax=Cichorium intybus TaxID=13427 RepID=A0ACB9GHH3_CICIN|nr:hypothetical protein L2E82_12580 [Cichorium intybus]
MFKGDILKGKVGLFLLESMGELLMVDKYLSVGPDNDFDYAHFPSSETSTTVLISALSMFYGLSIGQLIVFHFNPSSAATCNFPLSRNSFLPTLYWEKGVPPLYLYQLQIPALKLGEKHRTPGSCNFCEWDSVSSCLSNNAYIFPGSGLGLIISRANHVHDDMLLDGKDLIWPEITYRPHYVKVRIIEGL